MATSRRIAGITIELGADTTKLTNALKEVDKQLSTSASSLKDINKLLKLDPGNTTLLAQKQKELQTSIKGTKERLTELKSVQKESISPEKWDALQREIVDTEQQLKALEKEYKTFGSVAAQQIKAVGEKMKTIGSNIADVGKNLTTKVTAPIVAGFGAAIKVTADFDAQMSKVAAISGASGESLDSLRDKAREMGATTKFSAQEAGEAMEYMAMAGWNTQEMLDGIEGVMHLAAASGEELGTTSDIVTDALTAFGKSAADAGDFADVLAKASSKSNTNVSMMGETFKYVAPLAGSLGYDYRDVAVAIGLMANNGIKASQAGTSLRSLFTRLAKPTKQSAQAMADLGISMTKPNGQTKSLSELMKEIRERFAGLTEAEKTQYAAMLAGQNGMSGLLAIVNATDEEFASLTADIANSSGAAKEMAETMNDNLAGKITILKSTLQEIGIQFGEILMPYVTSFVEWVQKLATGFTQLDERVKKVIVVVGTVAAAIGPVLLAIGSAVKLGGTMLVGLSKITPVLQAVVGFLSGPAGIAVAIGVAVAALLHFTGAWDKIKEVVGNAWNKIKPVFDGLKEKFEPVKKSFNDLVSTVKGFFNGDQSLGDVGFVIKDLAEKFLGFLDEVVPGFKGFHTNVLKPLGSYIKTTFTKAWDGLKTFFTVTLPEILEKANTAFTEFKDGPLTTITNFVKDTVMGAWNTLKNVFVVTLPAAITTITTKFNEFKDGPMATVTNFVKDTALGAWNTLKNVFVVTLPAAITTITTKFNEFKDGPLTTVTNFVKNTAMSAWNELKTFFTETLPKLFEDAKTNFEEFKDGPLTTVTNFVKNTFMGAWKELKTFFTETLPKAIETIQTKFNEFKDGPLKDLFTKFNEFKDGPLKDFTTFVTTTVPDAFETSKTAFEDFKTIVLDPLISFISETFKEAWGALVEYWNTELSPRITELKDAFQSFYTKVLQPLWGFLTGLFTQAWEGIKKLFGADNDKDSVAGKTKSLYDTFNYLWNNLLEPVATFVTDTFATSWDILKEALNGVLDFITNVFKGDWKLAWEAIVRAFGNIFKTIVKKIKDPINTVIGFLNTLINKVEDTINTIIGGINAALTIDIPEFMINPPDWLAWTGVQPFGFPGFHWNPGLNTVQWDDIPTLASGGTVKNGGRAIVGEYAPEYLRVINGQAVVTPMGGGRWDKQNGNTITNNITINQQPGESSEQLAQRVQRVLVRWEKEQRMVFGT